MCCQISPLSLSVPTNTGAGAKVISSLITNLLRNPYPVTLSVDAPLRFHLRRFAVNFLLKAARPPNRSGPLFIRYFRPFLPHAAQGLAVKCSNL